MVEITLKKKRERSIVQGNPWIFSGAIDRVSGQQSPGAPCIVRTADGTLLGSGYYNKISSITVRMLSFGPDPFTIATLGKRIATAVGQRSMVLNNKTDSCRLINSEGDFLPGLIVDNFAGGLVIQILTAGMEHMRQDIIAALQQTCAPTFIYERSDSDARTREGLPTADGCCFGNLPHHLTILENDLRFSTDIAGGQKTGYFFDQRSNRQLFRQYTAGRRVADCFSYCGPFTVAALAGGALSVDAVDRSAPALLLVKENVALNGFAAANVTTISADIFSYLRQTTAAYDCIVLDPPKFARHPGEVQRASRGYKDINLLACKLLPPGGILFTFSCSHAIDNKLFRQIVFSAAADSGRRFQLLHVLSAGIDHPINLAHREGDYLKGLVLRAGE